MNATISTPRADHKQFCATIAPKAWIYTGFAEGYYCFQTGSYATGFKEILALDEDLTAKNMALMARLGVTR